MGREDRMVITKTEAVNKSKYAVSIDGEFAFVLYKGELHKYGIAENREISGIYMRKSWGQYCLRGQSCAA